MMEQMTLSELKTGMHVVLRDGGEYIVLKDTCLKGSLSDDYNKDIIKEIPSNGDSFTSLSNYNEDMTHNWGFKGIDIVAVYNCNNVCDMFRSIKDVDVSFTQIFAEEDTITREEAEKRLGVKIVD